MENKNKFNDLSKVPVELYDDGVYTIYGFNVAKSHAKAQSNAKLEVEN